MSFLMMVAASVAIGWLAQSWKGRTGAVWGFISLLIMMATWLVIYLSTAMVQPQLYTKDEGWYALGIMVAGGIGIIMALIVATLPEKEKPAPPKASIKTCRFCAEDIKADARFCPFCGKAA